MRWSHSSLLEILNCPASYYLNHIQGISLKQESQALFTGSAVHWGIEHNTDDLSDYLKEFSKFRLNVSTYNKDIILAEAMIHGYLKYKNDLFDKILTDYDGKTKLELLNESHEVDLIVPLKSYKFDEDHEWHGIIDLLLLTNKGFIIVDYKTSSSIPDFDQYLDQLYRYIYLINKTFPDTPVYKIAIINLIKSRIKQKTTESSTEFLLRLKREYDTALESKLINYYEFDYSSLNQELMNKYIVNLSHMCDEAQSIINNKNWFINYGNAMGKYGKSQYWNIFYGISDSEYLYKVKDTYYNKDFDEIADYRDCKQIDLLSLFNADNTLNHYTTFKTLVDNLGGEITDDIIDAIKKLYIYDKDLLENYIYIYKGEKNNE